MLLSASSGVDLKFDFGTTGSAVASGHTRVAHTTNYSSSQGYGWTAGQIGSRDRGTGGSLNRDLNFTANGTFAAKVPNGTYDVKVTLGDASFKHDRMDVYLEGKRVDTVNTAAGQFVTKTYRTDVSDGQLTLRLVDRGGDDPYTSITALQITGVGSSSSPTSPSSPSSPSDPIPSNALYVATNGNDSNAGSSSRPFKTIGRALNQVKAGQTIVVKDGVYNETLTTSKSGTSSNPITLRAENRGKVIVTNSGRTLNVQNPHYRIDGIVFDGKYGANDIVRVTNSGSNLIFRNNVVRHGKRDGIDMAAPSNVLIENSKIHNLLNFVNGRREDAHGIVTGGVKNLTVRGTEIYYVSGDALQVQYGGWDNVLVDRSHFWNGPLPQAVAGAPKGKNPGEDGIDTKQYKNVPAGRLTVRNSTFNGWRGDFINNSAGVNIKHNVRVTLDGNTFYDNEIGARLRGPGSNGGAVVTAMNNVFYRNSRAIRYEDKLVNLKVYNNTFGAGNSTLFQAAGGGAGSGFAVQNNLFLGSSKPSVASHSSNMAVSSGNFVNAGSHNYRLSSSSSAIDKGITLSSVTRDRDGVARPQGRGHDVGAYERVADSLFASGSVL